MKSLNTQNNKDSSKSSTASSNSTQLDELLDSFFQANKYKQTKKHVPQRTLSCNNVQSKTILSDKKQDLFSSETINLKEASKQSNSLQRDLNKNSLQPTTSSTPKPAINFFDSSSDEENILEQFKPYSSVPLNKQSPIQKPTPLSHKSKNQKNKILNVQSQKSNTPFLSDIKKVQSNENSQSNDYLITHDDQDEIQNKTSLQNDEQEVKRSLSSSNKTHFSSSNCVNQMAKFNTANLKSPIKSGFSSGETQEKTTAEKDSVGKISANTSSSGLSYLKNFKDSPQEKSHQKRQKFSNNNSIPVFSMNEILNRHRSENLSSQNKNDVQPFMSQSSLPYQDKSNKSSLSKIWEDQNMEDDYSNNIFQENEYNKQGSRLKNSASGNNSSYNKDQKNKEQKPLIQTKNIFNQNQLRMQQQSEEHESLIPNRDFNKNNNYNKQYNDIDKNTNQISKNSNFVNKEISYNNKSNNQNNIQNKNNNSQINKNLNNVNENNISNNRNIQNNINQSMNSQNKDLSQQLTQNNGDSNQFLSAQREEYKKYEAMHSKSQKFQIENYDEDSQLHMSQKQQSGKITIQKIASQQKFSSQPLKNNYFQTINQINKDSGSDSEEDLEYLKNIAISTNDQQKRLIKHEKMNQNQKSLSLFEQNPISSASTVTNLSFLLDKYKMNSGKQEENKLLYTQNKPKKFEKVNLQKSNSNPLFYNSEEEQNDKQISKPIKAQSQVNNRQPKQKKQKRNINSKRRRQIKEDDDDYDDVLQFFEDEAISNGDSEDEEEDDFIDRSSNPFVYNTTNKKRMAEFDDFEIQADEEKFKRQNIDKQSQHGAKLKKKLCLDDYDDEQEERLEKPIFRTESKKNSKEQQKNRLDKDNRRKNVVDSDESDCDKIISSSDKKKKKKSSKKKLNRGNFEFSESDEAVDENDDYEEDSFIDDESDQDVSENSSATINLNSPSNHEDDHELENKVLLNLVKNNYEVNVNKKKKKLIKGANLGEIESFQCSVCLYNPSASFFGEIDCLHRFCFSCIEDWAKVTNICPMCRKEFTKIIKRNFNGTVNSSKPTLVRRKKQKVNEEDYIEEAQALQDEEDRAAGLHDDDNNDNQPEDTGTCYKCARSDRDNLLLICDVCDENYCHTFCDESIRSNRVPDGRWACHFCRY